MTIVPLTVVAERIVGFKKTGIVPATATKIIAIRPFLTVIFLAKAKSTINILEKELNHLELYK